MRNPILLALAASLCIASAAAASPASGVWHAPDKNATIQVYDCGSAICGRVMDSDDLRANPDLRDAKNSDAALKSRKVKGLVIMTGLSGGPTEWSGGSVYDPTSGHTYHGSFTLVGSDTAHLKGCIIGPLCRTDTWTWAR